MDDLFCNDKFIVKVTLTYTDHDQRINEIHILSVKSPSYNDIDMYIKDYFRQNYQGLTDFKYYYDSSCIRHIANTDGYGIINDMEVHRTRYDANSEVRNK